MPTSGPISGACSCHSGCSVVGFSSKRIFPPLTVARLHSTPSLHGRYPLPRYYGLSDSREKQTYRGSPRFLDSSILTRCPQPPRRVRWLLMHTHYLTIDDRLHPLRQTGHSRLDNEAESGSLALRLASLPCKAS